MSTHECILSTFERALSALKGGMVVRKLRYHTVMGRHSDCPRDTSAKADVGPHLRVSSKGSQRSESGTLVMAHGTTLPLPHLEGPSATLQGGGRCRTPEYTHGGRPGKSGFGAHLSVFFLGLWPPNSSVFWNGLLGPPGFIRFPVTASKNGNKIGKNPIFLLGSAQAVRTAPAIERSC